MEAQSTAIGFLERFDDSSRYAEGASITALSSLPEIGDYAYRVRVAGGTGATVTTGALRPNANTLYYFQNRVATPGGRKFSMGFVFELERSSVYLTALNNGYIMVRITLSNGERRVFRGQPGLPGEDLDVNTLAQSGFGIKVKGQVLMIAAA